MATINLSFTTPGQSSFTLPTNIGEFSYVVNAAGGGGSGSDAGSPGATGGTGARLSGTVTGLAAGSTIRVYVGSGGGGGASSQGGAPGGPGGSNGGSASTGGGGGTAGFSGSSGGGGGGGAASYIETSTGNLLVVAGAGGGAGGAGNDGGGPSGFQFGGNGGTALSTSPNLTGGGTAANNGGDGGAGGGGGGGNPGGSAGFTPGSDSDAGGGSGGGSYYNPSFHSGTPSASVGGGSGGGQSSAGSNGSITITYVDNDGQPNPVANFGNITNAELNTTYTTSSTVTVSGINIAVPASATNGAIIIKNGISTGASSTTVVNGDTLSLQMVSSPSFSTGKSSTLTFGGAGTTVDSTFTIITKAAPINIPNNFDFVDVIERPLDTDVLSNAVTITGLTTTATVTASATTGGGASPISLVIDGTDIGASSGNINNGQTLALKVRTSVNVNTVTTANVVVGSGSVVDWNATTILVEDTAPDYFNFINATNSVAGSTVTSNTETINGINTASLVSVTGGIQVSINGGAFITPTSSTRILNGQTLQLRGTASSVPNATVFSTVTIGSPATGEVTDTWDIITGSAGDTTPDPFTFTDRRNQLQSVLVFSNTVIPGGFTSPATLSIQRVAPYLASNPQVSIDGGTTWANVPSVGSYTTSFSPGTSIQLRATSSAYGTAASVLNINLGGVSTTWTIQTLSAAPVGANKSTWYNSTPGTKLDGYAIGTIITTFRDSTGNWGTLDGELNSRYPGFIECDGRLVNAGDYPDLFDAIGNTYGGTATKSLSGSTYTYSGQFRLPNIRNRRLFGTGQVDGNRAASPGVPTRKGPSGTGSGTVNTTGSVGGDWYIATVDAAGTLPLEQVEGIPPATAGTTGQFYALGTVTTTGYSGVTDNINFNVAGNVGTTIGPLISGIVGTPGHSHNILSGVNISSNTGLMAWGSRATLGNGRITGTRDTSNVFPGGPTAPFSGLGGPSWSATVTYTNYWGSTKEGSLQLANSVGNQLGALDTLDQTATIRVYSPAGGTLTHTHYLSTTDFGNPNNVFSWGNVNGAGTKTPGMGGDNTVNVTFTHTEMGSRVNQGVFALSTAVALLPDVSLKPNRTIPLIQPFFRVKYLIKAY